MIRVSRPAPTHVRLPVDPRLNGGREYIDLGAPPRREVPRQCAGDSIHDHNRSQTIMDVAAYAMHDPVMTQKDLERIMGHLIGLFGPDAVAAAGIDVNTLVLVAKDHGIDVI